MAVTSNPFIPRIKDKIKEFANIHKDSSGIIEMLTKYIALIIVIIIQAVLLCTVGVLLGIHGSLLNLYKSSREKIKNGIQDNEKSLFPLFIEMAIYFILLLPLFILLIPYWVIEKIFVGATVHYVIFWVLILVLLLLFLCSILF